MHYTTSCNTQSSAPEDEQNNCPKHVEPTGIIKKPLLLHLVGCLYYLYQWCMVKQISHNEIYLLIKYIKSVFRRVAKRLSYIEDARCLKVNYRSYTTACRSRWPSGSAAARLLGLRVQIPPGGLLSVSFECCVLSRRGLCDGPVGRPEESYRLWCVRVWSWFLDNGKVLAN